jgi:hypothetical protein
LGTQINDADLQLPDATQIPASGGVGAPRLSPHNPKALLSWNGVGRFQVRGAFSHTERSAVIMQLIGVDLRSR